MVSFIDQTRIAIVGLGQLGGSLGLRLRQLGCRTVLGVSRRPESLAAAKTRGIISDGSTVAAEVLAVADLVFLCQPLTATIEFVQVNLDHFRPGSVVTDVGSVKGVMVRELRARLAGREVPFIGAHPMAGTEKAGLEQARADLFDGCVCFLTPTPDDSAEVVAAVARVWREIGACVLELDADRHNAAVAFASHLPHVAAGALVRTVLRQGDLEAHSFACSSGFRDATRVASGNVHMWTEIGRHNTGNILAALGVLQRELDELRAILERQDWTALGAFLESAKTARDQWCQAAAARRGEAGTGGPEDGRQP